MTRQYALCMLLEHGPMSRAELMACTGWRAQVLRGALSACLGKGWLCMRNHGGRCMFEVATA